MLCSARFCERWRENGRSWRSLPLWSSLRLVGLFKVCHEWKRNLGADSRESLGQNFWFIPADWSRDSRRSFLPFDWLPAQSQFARRYHRFGSFLEESQKCRRPQNANVHSCGLCGNWGQKVTSWHEKCWLGGRACLLADRCCRSLTRQWKGGEADLD